MMRIAGCRLSRAAWISVATALATTLALTWAIGAVPAAAAEGCGNEALRKENDSTALPDCRAYEMVSPAEKDGFNVAFGANGAGSTPFFAAPAAPSGDLASYYSFGSFAGNPSSAYVNQYLSTRTASGWSTQGISPVKQAPFYGIDVHTSYTGFSSDLSTMAVVDWVAPGVYALLLRNESGAFEVAAEAIAPLTAPIFAGASEDFSHLLIVRENAGDHLEEWSKGKLSPISGVDGTPSLGEAGAYTGPFGASWGRAISGDGSRVYWTPSTGGGPYLWENETQTNIAASQCTTGRTNEAGAGGDCTAPGTGSGEFDTSSLNGEVALFTSNQELTNDANTGTGNQGSDLYSYDAATGKLTDLTSDATANGAEVGGILGSSQDAAYVYFVAGGVLASGATQGAENLYLWHNGTITFVAALSAADSSDWGRNSYALQHSAVTQTSADGHGLLFTSVGSPTGYASGGHSEVYLYDASSGKLRCVSCNPAGTAATGSASLGSTAFGPQDGGTAYSNISLEGGRVFFQSPESLLPQDSNGLEDVYEWEADGVGGCESEAQDGGCLYSISTGTSGSGDYFQNATPSGQDVFFVTGQQLVGQDDDTLVDMYDARVDGGFPAPAKPPAPCVETTVCRGAGPPATTFGTPGSELTSGAGNLTAPVKESVKPAKPKPKKKLTRRQKLERALSQCGKRPPKKRTACRAAARRRYGSAHSSARKVNGDASTKARSGR